jgi:hypothetical protein
MLELGTVASTEPRLAGCERPANRPAFPNRANRKRRPVDQRRRPIGWLSVPARPASSGRVYHRRGREPLKKFDHL